MPHPETGKQRASRIPLDYYKAPDRLRRWKRALTAVALLATGGWLASGFLLSGQGNERYSHGPVAAVHAAWESNCTACHTPFQPISGGAAWTALLPAGFGLGPAREASQRCETCHAGPPHHTNQQPERGCADCHRDHQGRDASLVRVADADCTGCHAYLPGHIKSGAKTEGYVANISAFAPGSHPDSRSVRAGDPGKLKFNHALHMAPGILAARPFTLGHILDEGERGRYAKMQGGAATDKAPVQLDCASCHVPEGGDPARGAYMAPVKYENHCQACHPLTIDRQTPGDPTSPLVSVPHHLQPAAVRTFLRGVYAGQHVAARAKQEKEKGPSRPLPGQVDLAAETKAARAAVEKQVADVERALYQEKVEQKERGLFQGRQTCGECHHYATAPGAALPTRVLPTQVPAVWFKHAKFDHAPHRAVSCQLCHGGAYPGPAASTKNTDVLIPQLDNCVLCHAPKTTTAGGQPVGGARHDCVECHRYHHGEVPAQAGGAGRGATRPALDLHQFLSGGPRE